MNPLPTRNICFSVYYNGLFLSMFVCRCPMWYFQVVVPIISLYPDSCGVQPWPDEIPTTQTSLIIIKPGKIHAVFTQDQRCKRWPFDSPFCLLPSPQDATPHTNITGFVNINSPIQPWFDPLGSVCDAGRGSNRGWTGVRYRKPIPAVMTRINGIHGQPGSGNLLQGTIRGNTDLWSEKQKQDKRQRAIGRDGRHAFSRPPGGCLVSASTM